MISICTIKRSWKQINSSYSSGNSEKPMGLRQSLISIAINWNVMFECKALNLLLLVTFPNLQWKSMAQLGPGSSIPGLCLESEQWEWKNMWLHEFHAGFSGPCWKRLQFWNVHCYVFSAMSSLELFCDWPVYDKIYGSLLEWQLCTFWNGCLLHMGFGGDFSV